jgi:secreted trypsin-like serine protease
MAMRLGVVRIGVAAVAAVVLALPVAAGARAKARHAGARAHTAIVGGVPAPAGSWPWLAWIDDNEGPGEDFRCTGTVVAPNIVLTAAHCAEDVATETLYNAANFTVITGSLDWTNTAVRQLSAVSQLIVHPNVATTAQSYGINVVGDAALLVLAAPTTAPAIALANSSELALIQPGVAADMAGWGLTNPSDQTSLPDAAQEASTVVQGTDYCSGYNPYFSPAAQICASDEPAYTTNTCDGDSGGPLVTQGTDGSWVQIGITSTGTCNPAIPDTYTRVDYIDAWAQSWITALAPTPAPVFVTTPPAAITTPPPRTPGTPAPAAQGNYAGSSAQHRGHVKLTVGANGITRVGLEFNVRCSHGQHWRGPYTQTSLDTKDPIQLIAANGVWTFTTRYYDTAGNHYTLTGTFPTTSSATGTLSVVMHNHACSSGPVHWAASLPS